MDRTAIIEATRAALQSRASELTAAYLFGSVARGTAGAHSDIDLGVVFADVPEAGLDALGFEIATHNLIPVTLAPLWVLPRLPNLAPSVPEPELSTQ